MCLLGELIVKSSTDFTPFGTLFEPTMYPPNFIEEREVLIMERDIKEFISPVLDESIKTYKICCPLHFFALGRLKEVLGKNGYEIAHPEGIFFHRPSRELIYVETELGRFYSPYTFKVITTLYLDELENLFSQAFLEEYKNKHVLIEGTESYRTQNSLSSPNFDEIKDTLPQEVLTILEYSLWNFDDFCNKFSKNNLSNTLGILFYGPPGVGKTFVLRSYLNKLLRERKFTIVQVYQECLEHFNISVLLNSCKALFPCILLLEDIDIKFKDRQESAMSLAGFLLETFEGLSQVEKVALIATSNNVDVIEKALLRPGRIDYLVEIGKPSKTAKELVLSRYLDGLDLNLPLPLRETLINNADTFAEMKGAVQHVLRTHVITGDFPSIQEVTRLIRTWKEAKVVGGLENGERRMGLV